MCAQRRITGNAWKTHAKSRKRRITVALISFFSIGKPAPPKDRNPKAENELRPTLKAVTMI